MAVTIDDDAFIDMLWDRVDEFCPGSYSDEFWDAAFDYLKEVGWLSNPILNKPSYIVDNIYINGNIKTLEEIRENYTFPDIDMDKMSDDELSEYLIENGWFVMGDRFVKNLGL